jgi:ATP-dependent DNA helicase RecQ
MTCSNYDAAQIAGLLHLKGIKSKLIQSNDAFDLSNMVEIRFLMSYLKDEQAPTISGEKWDTAQKELTLKFGESSNLELCKNLMREFDASNTRVKYYSDFETFVHESNYEDMFDHDSETIYVSTMHKSKGREFGNVFLMLSDFDISSTENKRLLYVAMTRAKDNLMIHYNGNYFEGFSAENIDYTQDNSQYNEPDLISLQLTHHDVNLGYFSFVRRRIDNLKAGQKLAPEKDLCKNLNGETVLKFSKSFVEKIDEFESKGYKMNEAKVKFILYWFDADSEEERLIVLPEVNFKRSNESK